MLDPRFAYMVLATDFGSKIDGLYGRSRPLSALIEYMTTTTWFDLSPNQAPEDAEIPDGPYRAALRRRWAELIRRVYEVDPLICPRCGSEMRVVGFITQPALIDRILEHLRRRDKIPRPPPLSAQPLATPA